MQYVVEYRHDEIEAVVDANTKEEAIEKFLAGEVYDVRVNFPALRGDLAEASPLIIGGG